MYLGCTYTTHTHECIYMGKNIKKMVSLSILGVENEGTTNSLGT